VKNKTLMTGVQKDGSLKFFRALSKTDPRDVFNADETGLYWRAIPDGTLSFKNTEAAGCKVPKERVTLLLACNMDGSEKLEPLTIGKSKQPRCFKNVKRLPVAYEANKNAWMTGDIWKEWLKKLDRQMRSKKRQIVMLCDNCAAHSSDVKLTNIKLVFMPPNTTSLIQPMDQGIIANFKQHYRCLVLRHLADILENADEGQRAAEVARKLTLLDSLHMQKAAWDRVTTATIVNCYKRASFVCSETDEADGDEITMNDDQSSVDPPAGLTSDDFNRYVAVDKNIQTAADVTDDELYAGLQAAGEDADSDSEHSNDTTINTSQSTPAVCRASKHGQCSCLSRGSGL
jgi:hypothetical protein